MASYTRWLGHAAFELVVDNVKILIDPWISNPLSPTTIDELGKVDFVLVTHDHFDHLGETLDIARKTNATVVGIYDLTVKLVEKGLKEAQTIGMNIGGTAKLTSEIEVVMVPAIHGGGPAVGFIVKAPKGNIYHAGDTALFSDMAMYSRLHGVDLALLPIGDYYTMGPRDAAIAAQLISPKAVIPMHYNTFPLIKQDPELFKSLVEQLVPRVKVYVLKPGERLDLPIK